MNHFLSSTMEAPRVRAMEFSPLGRLIFLGVNQLIYEKCTRSATNLLVPFLAIFFFLPVPLENILQLPYSMGFSVV